ncbi:MAG: O-antigen ligase family protein [Planctomycetota bacterium]|nr:O-antigen ligase family protein [Planctomycetota bacterium]
MTRWAILLLPVAGLLAHDPLRLDIFGLKELVLTAGALLVGLLFAADAWRTGRPRLGWSDLSGALVVFLLVRGLMVWRAPEAGAEARSWALLLGLVLVHHICCASVSSAWLRRRAVPVLAATFGLLSALALVQASGLLEVRQVYGLFANRSFAGAGLAMLLPFALADERRRARVYVVLGLLALVTTQSRTGAIAAAAALALYFGWNRPRWRLPLLGSVVLAVLVVGVAFGERNTVKVRLHWYEAALKLGAAQPALGHGAGGFAREYPPIRPVEEHSISGGWRVHAVHNDYLQSWADGGALGLAAHLLLLVMAARAARRSRPAAASLLAFATASLVDLPLQDPSLLALAFLCLQMTARRRRTRVLTAPAFLSVYPALLAFSLFVVPAWSHWRADRQLASALEARQTRTEWRAALDRCLELEPGNAEALELRGGEQDRERLLLQRPHDGWTHFYLVQMRDREDVAGFEQILEKHDPHHVGTLVRLAELRMKADPLAAVSYLRRALAADPCQYLPYLTFARLRRLQGQYDEAFRMLEEAVQRSNTPAIFLEAIDLTLELSRNKKIAVAERDWRLRLSVRRAPRRLVIRRVDAALDAAQLI